jgi:hypothetical protein
MESSKVRAMPSMPAALGCRGKVWREDSTGSTHRLSADVQALCAVLGPAMST